MKSSVARDGQFSLGEGGHSVRISTSSRFLLRTAVVRESPVGSVLRSHSAAMIAASQNPNRVLISLIDF